MGLYLAIFESDDSDEEIDGVDVGSYSVFGDFRDAVVQQLEQGRPGSRFPVLIDHSDSEGTWTPEDAARLAEELAIVTAELGSGAGDHTDIEGDPLACRLTDLADLAIERGRPIEFQ